MTPVEFEAALRAIGAERYHVHHPFHHLLHGGRLTRSQVQAWALNRYYYQACIPAKDASLLARLPTTALRREWRRRLEDHDGSGDAPGGVERWLALTDGLGIDRDYVVSLDGLLPGTRFAVDAYVHFVRERSVLEAIASSLTEMFSTDIIRERVAGMLANYDFVSEETLAYFKPRLTQAPQDVQFALGYVKEHATSAEKQALCLAALRFKCDLLWAQLDALHFSYVSPGLPPPGAYLPSGFSPPIRPGRRTPRFAPGVRLHHDQARDRWVVMAPERMFIPDDVALEVLRLIDGVRDESAIVGLLAEKYAAPASVIAADIQTMLDDLVNRGAILR